MANLVDRDEEIIPKVLSNMLKTIENYTPNVLKTPGIYRQSGSSSSIMKLKNVLDQNPQASLEDHATSIHDVIGAMKLFFRELPDPVFPRETYRDFVAAASMNLSILFFRSNG